MTSSAFIQDRPIPHPHFRVELCVYQRAGIHSKGFCIDSISSLKQLAFSQFPVLMGSMGLSGMASPYQPGLALLALLLAPWDCLTLLTPAPAPLGQGVSLTAGGREWYC